MAVESSARRTLTILLTATLTLAATGWQPAVAEGLHDKEPVYVGAQACAECHEGPEAGHQYSRWRLSAHARAYATLALPESETIARLSGIPEEPHQARVCLGCHATAADAEEWERDLGFRVEDGVQCEQCHGPGSEYMDATIMADREAAMERGLRFPDAEICLVCHREKPSHQAVLSVWPWTFDEAWSRIAHAIPDDSAPSPRRVLTTATDPTSAHRFTGVSACGSCHSGPESGYQLSLWRQGPHANAYASLATAEAATIARQQGVEEDPQESPECLRCHTTGFVFSPDSYLPGFDFRDGVQCESCHGAGADYSTDAVMRDREALGHGGLVAEPATTCERCHRGALGGTFDLEGALARIAHPNEPRRLAAIPVYKTPVNLTLTPDGSELWVACESSASVIVVDTASRRKVAEIAVGRQPHDVAFLPDGTRAFVSNRLDDSLSVVDVETRRVVATVPVGDEPHGVLTDRSGRRLYVLDTAQEMISVVDTATFEEVKRLAASRSPWSLALSPDGAQIFVTNALSRFVTFRDPPLSEVTVIDTDRAVVENRIELPAANLLQGVAWHPSGEYGVVTLNRTKNLVPMTRLLQGWTITNGIGIVWRDGSVDQLLLDQPDLYFPDPADAAVTADGRYALVTSSGSNRLAVVDLDQLVTMLSAATEHERRRVFPNHLGKPAEFVAAFVATGDSPRGVVAAADSKLAYVANALDDSITVIDLVTLEPLERVDLGGPKEITQVRLGERLFHSANIAFRRQFSCHTCHPDGHVDGITYDIEPDGIGLNPVDNRTLRGISDTAPFKWTGKNKTLQRQCGPRLAVFFTRIQPFDAEQLDALELYISTIPRPPNRHRALGARLTDAQREGKTIYERAWTNDGRFIPLKQRCTGCHPQPLGTDRSLHDVGTQVPSDTHGVFDTPHLVNIYASAPYLHNGMSETLEEIWTRFNPYDQHGVTNDLTKDQLNHLIEYLKTL